MPLSAPHLRALFDSLSIGIIIADKNGSYVDVNETVCLLFGRTREDLIGRNVIEFCRDVRIEDVQVQWEAFLRDGTQSGEFEISLPDGKTRRVRFQARADFLPGMHCSFLTEAGHEEPDEAGLLTMCAWTKQVKLDGRWVTIEEYLEKMHDTVVTHGLSPQAFEKFVARD